MIDTYLRMKLNDKEYRKAHDQLEAMRSKRLREDLQYTASHYKYGRSFKFGRGKYDNENDYID